MPVQSLPQKRIPINDKVMEIIKQMKPLKSDEPTNNFILNEYHTFKHIFL